MVNSVSSGQTGDLGLEYDVQSARYKQLSNLYGAVDFKSMLFLNSVDGDEVLQRVENNIEGNESTGNGTDADLLTWDKYLVSSNSQNKYLFESLDSDLLTTVDFDNDYYEVMDENAFVNSFGVNGAYDTYEMTQNGVNFYEFLFEGIADGQDSAFFNLSDFGASEWGNCTYTLSEVDTSYWTDEVDTEDSESVMSHNSLDTIIKNKSQWLTDEQKTELAKYSEDCTEYWNKFYEFILTQMDQIA